MARRSQVKAYNKDRKGAAVTRKMASDRYRAHRPHGSLALMTPPTSCHQGGFLCFAQPLMNEKFNSIHICHTQKLTFSLKGIVKECKM